ncbi:MAG: excinuclease ABC subunit UvrC [Rhizobiales bacterium]|nr:excinuclease ABC subunit UvrC [Hyphomicrobiales bacterium]
MGREVGNRADHRPRRRRAPRRAGSAAVSEAEAEGAEAPRPPTGAAVIAGIVKRLPNGPGVYRMIDAKGNVLYVGKARSLKKRVTSYTHPERLSSRIARAIAATASMEFVSTRTETEALLLEANLIKRLRPRYNVLLRDDKSFPYILVTGDHPAPAMAKHRGARTRKGTYFGPFASAGAVARTINAMQRAFLVRTCSDSFYESRTRPCLLHQIKRCSAPCTGVISLEDYGHLVKEAEDFLSGRSQAVRTEMQREMEAASERLDFEAAAVYRDRIAALSHIQGSQGINPRSIEEADLFAMHQEGGHTCVEVFFFRTGQNWGNRAYYPRADRSLEPAQILGSFVAQFYDDKPIPKLILLSTEPEEMELLAEALSEKAGHRVTLLVPQRGERREIVEQAVANAKEALGRELAQSATQRALMEGLAEKFGLAAVPKRIEVYDNSHIMGTNPVGAMIVAGPEGFVKNQYRKFNMRSEELTPGDDYAMMREMLTRRFSRLIREAAPREVPAESETIGPWPDLVLIDGGRGQLAAAETVLTELGITELPIAGVAKGPDRDAGRETFFLPGRDGFMLQPRDPVLYFIQRLRDEAHRFAIGSHRTRRRIDMARNPLDEIDGIGPTRKRALLRHFGTAKAVGRASVSDMLAVPGISEQTAQAIYDFFHEGG